MVHYSGPSGLLKGWGLEKSEPRTQGCFSWSRPCGPSRSFGTHGNTYLRKRSRSQLFILIFPRFSHFPRFLAEVSLSVLRSYFLLSTLIPPLFLAPTLPPQDVATLALRVMELEARAASGEERDPNRDAAPPPWCRRGGASTTDSPIPRHMRVGVGVGWHVLDVVVCFVGTKNLKLQMCCDFDTT